MDKKKLNILISNDDGIHAPGILALIEVAKDYGTLTIVAPDAPQSGMSHAISIGKPLRLKETETFDGIKGFSCNGTPVDCVKLAYAEVMNEKPDLVLSGINHGSNSSVSVLYSGTMSAAMEGAIMGIPSVGFSLLNFSHDADFTSAKIVVKRILDEIIANPLPSNTLLNVNIPDLPIDLIKGIKVTRQAKGRYIEEFEKRTDPYGGTYFWLTGKFELYDEGTDCDEWALRNQYVSVTPVKTDMTSFESIHELSLRQF